MVCRSSTTHLRLLSCSSCLELRGWVSNSIAYKLSCSRYFVPGSRQLRNRRSPNTVRLDCAVRGNLNLTLQGYMFHSGPIFADLCRRDHRLQPDPLWQYCASYNQLINFATLRGRPDAKKFYFLVFHDLDNNLQKTSYGQIQAKTSLSRSTI
jgi:hypothetical protein